MNASLKQALQLYGKKNSIGGNRPVKTPPKPTHTKESILKEIIKDHFKRIIPKK